MLCKYIFNMFIICFRFNIALIFPSYTTAVSYPITAVTDVYIHTLMQIFMTLDNNKSHYFFILFLKETSNLSSTMMKYLSASVIKWSFNPCLAELRKL